MNLLLKTLIDTLYFTGMIILVGFILGYLRTNTISNFQKNFGWNAICVTAIIGVPIHELSHAIFALIFKHKITKIKLIQRIDKNGTLGYVNHSYNPISMYQQIGNFFIGVAPIFGGITSIIFLMNKLVPNTYHQLLNISISNLNISTIDKNVVSSVLLSYYNLIKTMFSIQNFGNINFLIFLFLAICISSHISLSVADIKGASIGFIFMFIVLFIINSMGFLQNILTSNILRYNILMLDFLVISIIFSTITYFISVLLLMTTKISY